MNVIPLWSPHIAFGGLNIPVINRASLLLNGSSCLVLSVKFLVGYARALSEVNEC